MDDAIREEVGHLFIDVGNKILSGNCVWNEEQMLEACNAIGHVPVSKENASIALNMSRSKFDTLVKEGKLPKGRKEGGFKELKWYVDELVPKGTKICTILKRLRIF